MRPEGQGSNALVLAGVGLVSSVGLTARSSAAALRAGITRFEEVPFVDWGGVPVIAAPVHGLGEGTLGLERHVSLLEGALADLRRGAAEARLDGVPLLVGVPAANRPAGAKGGLGNLIPSLAERLAEPIDVTRSALVEEGETSVHRALATARQWIRSGEHEAVIVAGVDSLVNASALDFLQEREALKTPDNPDGVIPGEGAGAVLLRVALASDHGSVATELAGLGFGIERNSAGGDRPNTGEGLVEAIQASLEDAAASTADTHFRLSDAAGERWGFTEANYAMARTLSEAHPSYPLWLPSESFGALGAAAGVAGLVVASVAFEKGYSPGPGVLCQASAWDGTRSVAFCRPLGGERG